MKVEFGDLSEFISYLKKRNDEITLEKNKIKRVGVITKQEVKNDFTRFFIVVTAFDRIYKELLIYKERMGSCIVWDNESVKKKLEECFKREEQIKNALKDFVVIRAEFREE